VYWIPAARRSEGAEDSAPLGEPCFLMGAGDNLVLQWPSMPAQLRQQLIDLNHYNEDARTLGSAGKLPAVDSLVRELPLSLPAAASRRWRRSIGNTARPMRSRATSSATQTGCFACSAS